MVKRVAGPKSLVGESASPEFSEREHSGFVDRRRGDFDGVLESFGVGE
jgi:hypothetical protein